MAVYTVIAGAVPVLNNRKVNAAPGTVLKREHVVPFDASEGSANRAWHDARHVGQGDLVDETFFEDGEVGDLLKAQFIEAAPEKAKPAAKPDDKTK